MCGFLAVDSKEFDLTTFCDALEKNVDRGPDMTETVEEDAVMFGFNRLAIMDLSDDGMQPFKGEDCTLVCNGEIYNFLQLKENVKDDFSFQSSSDCEVLIPLYRKYGLDTMCKMLDSEFAGDEPYMLARNLPGVVVVVDKNRVKAGHYAITEFGADTLILDDGFQYLPLRGQLQLLLVDKTNPFGNMNLLPRGILREPVSHLKRASYIFVTKSDGKKDAELERLIRTHNPTAEIIECAHKTTDLVAFSSGSTAGLDMLKGAKIACFSAIAAPDSFENFLSELGAEIIYKKRFLDHHRFDDQELDEFFENAKNKGAEFVVTTEKDAVRIRADYPAAIPFFYTKLEIEILDGVDDFESAVEKICFPKRAADSTHGNA